MPKPPSTSSTLATETETAPPPAMVPAQAPPPAETTSTTTAPAKAKAPRSPLFREPPSPPGPKTGSLAADPGPESPTASAVAAPPAPPASARNTAPGSLSTPTEPARSEVKKPVRAEIKKFLKDLVNLGAQIVHHVGTYGDEAQQRAGVWLATAEQAEAIAEPAASLVLDHVPPALLQSAVVNGLRVLVGIGSYADHHLTVRREVRYAAGFKPGPQSRPQQDVTGDIDRAQ